jgi:hypothetical protein
MADNPTIAWNRVAVEAPVIVISILLAFAIDAWWEERDERQAEIVLLERLRADYTEIRSALGVVEDEHRAAAAACIYFMNLQPGETLPATPEVDGRVALVFLAARTFNPGSGAVESLYSGAGIQLIRKQALADKLLAWSGIVEELQEEEANLQKGVAERWSPYLASRTNIGPYVAVAGELRELMPGHVAAPDTRAPLLVDEAFINHVLDRFKWQTLALRDIEPIRRAVDEILALIDAELGD